MIDKIIKDKNQFKQLLKKPVKYQGKTIGKFIKIDMTKEKVIATFRLNKAGKKLFEEYSLNLNNYGDTFVTLDN